MHLNPPFCVKVWQEAVAAQCVSLHRRCRILRPHRRQKTTNTGHLLPNSSWGYEHVVQELKNLAQSASLALGVGECSKHLHPRSFPNLQVVDKDSKGPFFFLHILPVLL